MMRVIVEVHPFGLSDAKREIARIDIGNVSGMAAVSDYDVEARLADRGPVVVFQVQRHARADGWERLVETVVSRLREVAHGTSKEGEG